MDILIINSGSSSLKYQLINMENETVVAKGLCERITIDGRIKHTVIGKETVVVDTPLPSHSEAFSAIISLLTKGENAVISSLDEIEAVGHRTAYAKTEWEDGMVADDEVVYFNMNLLELAPLHIPAMMTGIRAAKEVFSEKIMQVAIADTYYHKTIPPKSFVYPIPYEYYEQHGVRRYGFHSNSIKFVVERYLELKDIPADGTNIVVCHLGNGSSITAVKDGKSFDTSMGFSPLEGLMMGTRSGTVDPAIMSYIANKEGKSIGEVLTLLNKQSGFLGLSGKTSDCRDLEDAAAEGDEVSTLIFDILAYQIKKYVGMFAAAMGGLSAVIFTGGIGENMASLRFDALSELEDAFGLKINKQQNDLVSRKEGRFSTEDSIVDAMVIPTNEELMMARIVHETVVREKNK